MKPLKMFLINGKKKNDSHSLKKDIRNNKDFILEDIY